MQSYFNNASQSIIRLDYQQIFFESDFYLPNKKENRINYNIIVPTYVIIEFKSNSDSTRLEKVFEWKIYYNEFK